LGREQPLSSGVRSRNTKTEQQVRERPQSVERKKIWRFLKEKDRNCKKLKNSKSLLFREGKIFITHLSRRGQGTAPSRARAMVVKEKEKKRERTETAHKGQL